MSVVTIMVGLVSLLADWFFRASMWGRRSRDDNRDSNQIQALFMLAGFILAILAPVIAQLIQLAISRSREYLADASAAKLTRYPEGLAQALEIIASDHEPLEAANKATAHMYITNPFHLDSPMRSSNLKQNGVGMFSGLFNTHPPVQDRIKALRS
jgi:heat shock protein HtpX